jgi:hypothetical protein
MSFDRADIRQHALRFSRDRFMVDFRAAVERAVAARRETLQ